MAVDIGPKIGIEGERQFRNEIAQVNQALKTLAAEGKAVTSSFDAETSAEKRTAAQTDVLNRQIETQKDKLALLEKGLRESAQMYGEADTRTMKWQQAVHEATATLNTMERELRGTDETVEDTADAMEDAGEATKRWADVLKGQLLADAVKAGLKAIADMATKAATAFFDASKSAASYADDILTLATTTGLSTDALQEYKYMADLTDTSLETITGSLTKLTSTMSKAKSGEGDAAEIFQDLGIAVTGVDGQLRDVHSVFKETITALVKIDNETERDAKAMTLFGKSAKELNSLMAAGADSIAKMGQEARATGYVLSGSALQALGKQQDAMDRLSKQAEAVRNNFAVQLAPGMTKAYEAMGRVLDNPRVRRALDLIAEGIGAVVEKAAYLAEKVLPNLLSVFGLGDVRLKTFTDEELALAAAIDEIAAAYEERNSAFTDSAVAIIDETKRTESLWKELQKLADENGNVQDADRDRANYILNELNKALDTEYTMNGNLIEQYQTMKSELANIIKQREAEALLEAGREKYTQDLAQMSDALQDSVDAYDALRKAEVDLKVAEDVLAMAEERANEQRRKKLTTLSVKQMTVEETRAVNEQRAKVDELRAEYEKANKAADDMHASVAQYQRAEQEALAGNYAAAILILTSQTNATLEYYRRKKELSEQDKENLRKDIADQERVIEVYKQKMEDGLTGYTSAGLEELEAYLEQAKRILNGEEVAGDWLDGLIRGLTDRGKIYKVVEASKQSLNEIVRTAQRTLEIRSPSRVAEWIGKMWDEGLIKGMEESEALLAKAASGLADTITASSTPDSSAAYAYGNGLTAAGSGYGTASSSYTTNLGGITVRIDGAGEVNEDVLAERVAVKLTDELIRAQRGGRL